MLTGLQPIAQLPGPDSEVFLRVKRRALELYKYDLTHKKYHQIAQWMANRERFPTQVQLVARVDLRRALWAVKIHNGSEELLLPMLRDRELCSPVDVVAMEMLNHFAPRLRYMTGAAKRHYENTDISFVKNYGRNLTFERYVIMCEMCRKGESKSMNIVNHALGTTIHRVLLSRTERDHETYYVSWHTESQLVTGTMNRDIIVAFKK